MQDAAEKKGKKEKEKKKEKKKKKTTEKTKKQQLPNTSKEVEITAYANVINTILS